MGVSGGCLAILISARRPSTEPPAPLYVTLIPKPDWIKLRPPTMRSPGPVRRLLLNMCNTS